MVMVKAQKFLDATVTYTSQERKIIEPMLLTYNQTVILIRTKFRRRFP